MAISRGRALRALSGSASRRTRGLWRWTRLRRRGQILLSIVVVIGLLPAWSLARAVTAPGADPVAAKAAEWARGHGLGFVVTGAEELGYRLNPPRTGGLPDRSLLPRQGPSAPRSGHGRASQSRQGRRKPAVFVVRPPLASLAGRALPGEGVFRAVVTVAGRPAVQLAYLRPDQVHTSYLTAVLVFDSSLLRFVLHPGYADPGHLGLWSQPDSLPPGARAGLAATFNGGFKLKDARGGYYADGHTLATLQAGAASMVITRDGRLTLGAWGRDVSMTSRVVSVRQNLRLLVDHGRLVSNVDSSTQAAWGATIGGADFVWRSGLGVTSSGDVVYVVGPALSARSLGQVLERARAVRAMELDINPAWVSGMWYSAGSTVDAPVPHKVLAFKRPGDRYLSSVSRDFVAVYAR